MDSEENPLVAYWGDRVFGYLELVPSFGSGVFLAPGARVIGDVRLGTGVSIWFNAVLRGDIHSITVGDHSNIQDGCVVHVTSGTGPVLIGSRVTVGHNAVIHGCTVGDDCLVGMGAVILDGADIGAQSLIAAGAVVGPGVKIAPGSLAAGVPARVIRQLNDEEKKHIRENANHYLDYARTMSSSEKTSRPK